VNQEILLKNYSDQRLTASHNKMKQSAKHYCHNHETLKLLGRLVQHNLLAHKLNNLDFFPAPWSDALLKHLEQKQSQIKIKIKIILRPQNKSFVSYNKR